MQKSSLLLIALAGCGGSSKDTLDDPTAVPFGTTAIVVVINPVVNDANAHAVPSPGGVHAGVTLTSDDGVSATSGEDGIVVLAPVTAGTRVVEVSGAASGSFTVTMADGALREIAIAADGSSIQTMLEVDYKTDRVMEVNPGMTNAQVNDILKVSDTVVFFAGGHYAGDLEFGGSRVTLFGEGVLGGRVVIEGNVLLSGSDSRIRGTHITGNLTIPASKAGLSFSRVDGTLTSEGSDVMMLANLLCGAETVTGSGTFVLGNTGAAPSTSCP